MNKRKMRMVALVVAIGLSSTAQAELQGRDLNGSIDSFEAYYDTDLNITWLADANYAQTSGYDSSGAMDWANSNLWAANLSLTDGISIYDNWRLPTVNPVNGISFNYTTSYIGSTDQGYNSSEQGTAYAGSTGSEMAHLFYNTLNNKGYCDPVLSTEDSCSGWQEGWGLTNTGPFANIQANGYWSESEGAPNTGGAWVFFFNHGFQQNAGLKNSYLYAWAVSDGDVGIAAVPEPETYAMMLAGLGLVGFMARRRRKTETA